MKMKRFFALMLALALSLTLLQGVAFGATLNSVIDATGATINGTSITMKYRVTKINPPEVNVGVGFINRPAINTNTPGALVIPTTVTSGGIDYTVTSISSYAFSGCTSLTSVTLPDSVTTIDIFAFDDCTSLTSVTLPDGLETIESFAFSGCTFLTSITIPAGVTAIGGDAFDNSAIKTITFEGSSIDKLQSRPWAGADIYAFGGAKELANIYFAGAYVDPDTATMAGALAEALTKANKNPTMYYNDTWTQTQVDAFKQALIDGGLASPNIKPYTVPTTGGGGGSGGSAGAGAWYIGTLNGADGQPTYTQIVDIADTTAMLETGNVITVTGQSPTGIIVKLDPTVLAGKQSLSINSSIANMQLTAEQIASLIQQADGNTIYITIKWTADGVAVTATAGGVQVTL